MFERVRARKTEKGVAVFMRAYGMCGQGNGFFFIRNERTRNLVHFWVMATAVSKEIRCPWDTNMGF